ncbi:phosphoribosylglycinamide formyltransferase [Convivina praedatoris]|uniref:Phosphoribosylglycinamide formyltransferase n=1 Tax=Convivina praedatoris TaxID=2880963 RepID=A0ABM9D1F8_9LACO|nr:phosphoribosylglycinamide formyltransferase [Convivina sp. LMG 32447]CAH1851625.1 Phosphoribosylglycinamide formyltransferase [Convivina sp. LMG 32447]CAH1853677.1 Phosphoribosylglycinamide formyltransferase [Convivina sp. LMG 32447]CAH1854376.1 Phosphoribosylglycinamide formyltransferase [Convivina sp. LMG 32447]
MVKKIRLAVFASGRGTNLAALQTAIVQKDLPAQIVRVIVDQRQAGAFEIAAKWNLPARLVDYRQYSNKSAAEEAILDQLAQDQVQGILLAGYMRILSPTMVHAYAGKIINLHPALLPAFPGRQSILDAYQAGVNQTGVTVHFVDDGVDTGQIIAQQRVIRYPDDQLSDLENRIHQVEHQLYPQVLAELLEKGVFTK